MNKRANRTDLKNILDSRNKCSKLTNYKQRSISSHAIVGQGNEDSLEAGTLSNQYSDKSNFFHENSLLADYY